VTIEIVVPEVAPSLNRLMRLHWAARRRLLKKWEWIMYVETYRVRGPTAVKFEGKLSVRITRRSRKTLDHDNLYGSAKLILDAMTSVGLLLDDDPAHIELICEQERGTPQTTIKVMLAPSTSEAHPVSQC
jgi:Holliday junction resolvase RusA-like endonuclease